MTRWLPKPPPTPGPAPRPGARCGGGRAAAAPQASCPQVSPATPSGCGPQPRPRPGQGRWPGSPREREEVGRPLPLGPRAPPATWLCPLLLRCSQKEPRGRTVVDSAIAGGRRAGLTGVRLQGAARDADVPRFPALASPVGIPFPASQRPAVWAETLWSPELCCRLTTRPALQRLPSPRPPTTLSTVPSTLRGLLYSCARCRPSLPGQVGP